MTEVTDATPSPTGEAPAKKRPRWLAPVIAGAVGLALGAGGATVVAENTIGKWSAKVDTVTAERDHFRTSFAAATEQRDEALEAVQTVADRETALEARAEELDAARVELLDLAGDLEEREKAVGLAEEKAAANSITEGVWLVGEDIKAGRYRTKEEVSGGSCYWKIHKGSDIIDNEIVTGGRPTVTLRDGQEFTTQRCGTWVKQ